MEQELTSCSVKGQMVSFRLCRPSRLSQLLNPVLLVEKQPYTIHKRMALTVLIKLYLQKLVAGLHLLACVLERGLSDLSSATHWLASSRGIVILPQGCCEDLNENGSSLRAGALFCSYVSILRYLLIVSILTYLAHSRRQTIPGVSCYLPHGSRMERGV